MDVWLRFRKIHDFRATEVSRNRLYYSVSILGPALITILTMILQFVADPETTAYIHPRLGNYFIKTIFFSYSKFFTIT